MKQFLHCLIVMNKFLILCIVICFAGFCFWPSKYDNSVPRATIAPDHYDQVQRSKFYQLYDQQKYYVKVCGDLVKTANPLQMVECCFFASSDFSINNLFEEAFKDYQLIPVHGKLGCFRVTCN